MPDNNSAIAAIFLEIADILDIKKVEWKPRAYRQAARSLESLNKDVSEIYKEGGLKSLEDIPGIGDALGKKIIEYLETKKIKELDKLKKNIPNHLDLLLKVPGMGPKSAKKLYDSLDVKTINQLEKACKEHKVSKLPGFGEKSEQDILESIQLSRLSKGKMPYKKAKVIATTIINHMKRCTAVKKIEYAGSLRRKKPMVRDIDILVETTNDKKVMEHFKSMRSIKKVTATGETKTQVILDSGVQVDLRTFTAKEWGAGLLYFTGSKDFNIYLRKVAIKKGLKLNEYGLFNKSGKLIASRKEKDIFKALGLDYVPPEKRAIK